MRTLCFGEAIVDLICERQIVAFDEADSFVPHVGGVVANVAATAAQLGAGVSLAGGVGDDAWGAWARDALAARSVDLRWFTAAGGGATPVAFVTVDEAGEPSYELVGDSMAAPRALGERLVEAVELTDALLITSNTLAGKAEAKLTQAARRRALELGKPVVVDANLRLGRWGANPGRAGKAAASCAPGAFLVQCNAAEARLMTGEVDPEAAAASLLAAGAQHVVVTLGGDGAILRAPGMRYDVAAAPARVRSTLGAGDAFLGVLLARLALTGFYPAALAAALPEAAGAAARACERWGALQ